MKADVKQWSKKELHDDVALSIAAFRQKRIGEPAELWRQTYFERRSMVRRAFKELDLRHAKIPHSKLLSKLYAAGLGDVLRYMAAPPVSEDDLKVIADIRLSRLALSRPPQARSLLRTLLASLDHIRFPWLALGVTPSQAEWKMAIGSTTALMTSQAVATHRRNTGKKEQEEAVRTYLRDVLNLTEVAPRKINTVHDAPKQGEFCAESEVMGEKADIVVSLFDNRLLLIECKVSNSALNSVKRVVHEASGKAAHWLAQLGKGQVIPAAVLSGVFNPRNLVQAQDKNLVIFWAHRLDDLGDFINATKPGARHP